MGFFLPAARCQLSASLAHGTRHNTTRAGHAARGAVARRSPLCTPGHLCFSNTTRSLLIRLSRGGRRCASSVICAFPIQNAFTTHPAVARRSPLCTLRHLCFSDTTRSPLIRLSRGDRRCARSVILLFRHNAFTTHPAVARLQVLSSVLCDTKRVRHSPGKAYAPCYQRRHADGGQPDSAGRQRNCGNKKPRTGRGWKGCAAISYFPGGSPGLSHGVWRCDHRQSRDRQS